MEGPRKNLSSPTPVRSAAAVLSIITALFVLWSCGGAFWKGGPPPPEPHELESRARDILEAAGAEQYYREVIYLGEQTQFLNITTRDKKVLFSLEVRVTAGLDLGFPLTVETRGWDEILVSLPPPKILSIDADENTLNQYFIKERGSRFTRLEYYDAILIAKEKIRQEAVRRGILRNASENVRLLLTSLYQGAGFKTVTFREARNLMGESP